MHKSTAILISLLLVGSIVRLWLLGTVPHGFSWDEAAIGYNGYAIYTTRRDEWLERLPVSFRSFGDYKAPLAIYINGFSTRLFGLNPLGVRLPFALFGVMAIVMFYYLCLELFRQHTHGAWYALVATGLFATSPWAIHFARIGFESGMALTFVLFGLLFFFKGMRTKTNWMWWLSSISFVASVYVYHSSKIAVPLLLIALVLLMKNHVFHKSMRGSVVVATMIATLLSWPLIKDAIWGHGLERANTTILATGMPFTQSLFTISTNFVTHLSPSFLIAGASDSLRHSDGQFGVHFPTTVLLLAAGLYAGFQLVRGKWASPIMTKRGYVFVCIWLIAGILPAAIATEVPHPNRSLLALPAFLLLATVGLAWVVETVQKIKATAHFRGSHGEQQLLIKTVLGTMAGIHVLFFVAYAHHYFTQYSALSSTVFADGYLEAFAIAVEYEKGINGKPKADSILFTSEYGQPYIYALFTRKTNPIWYQGGSLATYQFTDSIQSSDLERSKTLIVAGKSSGLPLNEAEQLIYGADGNLRFAIFKSREW